jgi:CBS domain-containing protein
MPPPIGREEECMQVKDYMQTRIITVSPQDLVSTAAQRMRGHTVRHLPVVTEANILAGLVTDRDIRRAGASDEPHMAEHELLYLLDKMTVQEIMTSQVHTVREETSVADAGRLLLEHRFGCLPVVREDNTLAGIITVTDLLRAYVQQHEATHPAA